MTDLGTEIPVIVIAAIEELYPEKTTSEKNRLAIESFNIYAHVQEKLTFKGWVPYQPALIKKVVI